MAGQTSGKPVLVYPYGTDYIIKKKEDVTLTGFGKFSVVKRKARKGRNPQIGEEIKIKETKVPKFTPGRALKEAVK